MEASSQPLATDSFSYSWLTNPKPSFDELLQSLKTSLDHFHHDQSDLVFRIMQPTQHYGQNNKLDPDFNFNIHLESRSSNCLIPADEIFSDGCIMPVYPIPQASVSVPASPVSLVSSIPRNSAPKQSSPVFLLKKLRKSSNRLVQKSVSFFSRIGCSRNSVRVDDLNRKVLEVRSRSESVQASPDIHRPIVSYDSDFCYGEIRPKAKKNDADECLREVRSCNNSPWGSPPRSPSSAALSPLHHHVESSIDEAILHCKRSFASK